MQSRRFINVIATVVATALAMLVTTTAAAQTINVCQSKKKLCVAKKAVGLLKCHAKAETRGGLVDPSCIQRARDRFDGGGDPANGCFGKLEAKGGCLTTNDTSDLESTVDGFVDDVVVTLHPGYPIPVTNSCSAGKKKCVAKRARALLKCHAKAERTGVLDAVCVQKAEDRFDGGIEPARGCFARLESQGGCLTTGDTPNLAQKVDDFVRDVVCALDGVAPVCFPSPTPTATPTVIPTVTPGGACPSRYKITAKAVPSDVDVGWSGATHDNAMTSNSRLTLGVSGCANPLTPCGQCTLSGPFANAGGAAFDNQRCRGDDTGANGTWMPCTSHADCPGVGNACSYFFGPPQPISAGGFPACTLYEVASPVVGAIDVDTGVTTIPISISWLVFIPSSLDDPCPRCVFGSCTDGPRMGQSCTVQGTAALYGDDVSLDCPPSTPILNRHPQPFHMTLDTGTQSLTLTSASPNCRGVGFTGSKCQCDTCNSPAAEPCHTNADCVAVGASVCGGRRCIGGTNNGTPCSLNSECPGGGVCTVPGDATKPNECDDGVCTANPADTDSIDEGVCADGPVQMYCAILTYRPCGTNADCPPGDACTDLRFRECFTDNGVIGNSVTAAGIASTTSPTFGAATCIPTVVSSSNFFGAGTRLPSAGRFTFQANTLLY